MGEQDPHYPCWPSLHSIFEPGWGESTLNLSQSRSQSKIFFLLKIFYFKIISFANHMLYDTIYMWPVFSQRKTKNTLSLYPLSAIASPSILKQAWSLFPLKKTFLKNKTKRKEAWRTERAWVCVSFLVIGTSPIHHFKSIQEANKGRNPSTFWFNSKRLSFLSEGDPQSTPVPNTGSVMGGSWHKCKSKGFPKRFSKLVHCEQCRALESSSERSRLSPAKCMLF